MQQIKADLRIDTKDIWSYRISHPQLKHMSMSHAIISFSWPSVVAPKIACSFIGRKYFWTLVLKVYPVETNIR